MPVHHPLDDDYPRAIRELLARLGVDLEFWSVHADRLEADEAPIRRTALEKGWDVDELRVKVKRTLGLKDGDDDEEQDREEKKRRRSQLAQLADEIGLELESESDEEISGILQNLTASEDSSSPRGLHGFPGILVLIADGLTVLERHSAAQATYSLAVDLAPTPQAQMEVGYLLASRGAVRFPGYWAYADLGYSPPILLLPDRWLGHKGLPYFEVVYEELLPGPAFPDSMAVLRLALEAYGRVFAHCYPPDESGSTAPRNDPLQAFAVDGLHTLLAAFDAHDMNLVVACFQTLWDWSATAGDVEDRLRISETYLKGYEDGRVDVQTGEKADSNLRRTMALDPDEHARRVAEELAKIPHVQRQNAGELLRQRFGPLWTHIPQFVQYYLELAEWQFRTEKAQKAWDFRASVRNFADAAEAALRDATRTKQTLGEFAQNPRLVALLRSCLQPSAPFDGLQESIRELADIDNPRSHGQNPPIKTAEGDAEHAKERASSIVQSLVKYQRSRR